MDLQDATLVEHTRQTGGRCDILPLSEPMARGYMAIGYRAGVTIMASAKTLKSSFQFFCETNE